VARTANSIGELNLSPQITIAVPPGDHSPADIEANLSSHGIPNNMRYLGIRAVLRSLDGERSPVFRSMDIVHYCD
jgi:hypothetical protein